MTWGHWISNILWLFFFFNHNSLWYYSVWIIVSSFTCEIRFKCCLKKRPLFRRQISIFLSLSLPHAHIQTDMLSNVRKSKIKLESVKWEVAKSGMLFRCLSWFGSWLLVESRISSYMLSMYVTTELQPQALKCFFVTFLFWKKKDYKTLHKKSWEFA